MSAPARRHARLLGLGVVLIGIWGGLVPFVGPTFGFTMGHAPAWTWSASRAELHVAPAVGAVVGGLLMMGGLRRATLLGGGVLAAIGGVWFVIAPALRPLWAGGSTGMSGTTMHSGMGMMGATQSTGMTPLEAIGYHYGPGAATAVLASIGLRMALVAARAVAPATVPEVPARRRRLGLTPRRSRLGGAGQPSHQS